MIRSSAARMLLKGPRDSKQFSVISIIATF